jgi:hypothetical protein
MTSACSVLQIRDILLQMATKAKRTKRDNRIVAYIRLRPEEHARIAKIVKVRGYPHTFASVAAEMISRGLTITEVKKAS